MTKEKFLNGESFYLSGFGSSKGDTSYKFKELNGYGGMKGQIIREIRSNTDGTIILSTSECTVNEITDEGFDGSEIILNTIVNIHCTYEEMREL